MDIRVAELTVSVVEPDTRPSAAPMVVGPAETATAFPGEVIVATPVALELQTTSRLKS